MTLLLRDQKSLLLKNGLSKNPAISIPVVHLILPGTTQSWLISEMYEVNPNVAYGIYSNDGKISYGEIDLESLKLLKGHSNPDQLTKNILFPFDATDGKISNEPFIGQHPLELYYHVAKELGVISVDQTYQPHVWKRALNLFKLKISTL